MPILDQLREDYRQFPRDQHYQLYAADVYFQDPLTTFRGIQRYQAMIQFMQRWFQDIQLELHGIEQVENDIHSQWTLTWTAPLPWQPRMAISGRSHLTLNAEGLISSHIDDWDCSVWEVFLQIWRSPRRD